jgi:DNA-binding CsgD family transcriptional regulator
MNRIARDIMMHYGMPMRSGRYPWGSGDDPFQSASDWYSRVKDLRKSGMSDQEVATALGLRNTNELRTAYSIARSETRRHIVESAKTMTADGKSRSEIIERLGLKNESSLRSLLSQTAEVRQNQAQRVADFLREQVNTKGMIDVGSNVEGSPLLNCSKEKLKQAIYILEMEGYPRWGGGVKQVTGKHGEQTNMQVLCPPGTPHSAIFKAFEEGKINSIDDYVVREGKDGEDIVEKGFKYPESFDSKRLAIRYAEDGGNQKDGLIEIRRGVDDVSMGDSHYSQVRVLVDGDHYLKGMALYSDDLPAGVDIQFNTNKSKDVPMMDVLKAVKKDDAGNPLDPDNPFGASIKPKSGQTPYYDSEGNRRLSVVNKVSEEGDWKNWHDALSHQFLSKQNKSLIQRQLKIAADDVQQEYDDIMAINNPTVRRKLLEDFANNCDHASIHMQGAKLPRQKYQVILPITSLKDNEVFAPNFVDGETVALIRYPHAGPFEIPILKNNRKHAESLDLIGSDATDAIGINPKVASILSGADFDGDTVMVIPCNSDFSSVKISHRHPLKDLEGFDAKIKYGSTTKKDDSGKEHYFDNDGHEFKRMRNTNIEMGKISNLITDMTLLGAKEDELARAVKHSMVVIDAEKHKLNYKKSYEDNAIAALKREYQTSIDKDGNLKVGGASTLLSRAKSPEYVIKRKGSPQINQKGKAWYNPDLPEGAKIWKSEYKVKNIPGKKWYDPNLPDGVDIWRPVKEEYEVSKKLKDPNTGKYILDPQTGRPVRKYTGKFKLRTDTSSKMEETRDARTLLSEARTPEELLYADYANKMKAMANQARKELVYTGTLKYNKSAKEAYAKEVASLNASLKLALYNHPRERQAQLLATQVLTAKKNANPDLSPKELGKLQQQEITKARLKVGAQKVNVKISDREWAAIQAGAITDNVLKQILDNTDVDRVRELATPRASKKPSASKVQRMKSLSTQGYTNAEIAEQMGVSPSTVSDILKGKE